MSATKTVLVRCTYTIPVEVPAEWSDHDIEFHIEENGCPGTGVVGAALYAAIDRLMEAGGDCWACAGGGENKVVVETPKAREGK